MARRRIPEITRTESRMAPVPSCRETQNMPFQLIFEVMKDYSTVRFRESSRLPARSRDGRGGEGDRHERHGVS
jgi:hypothetical protein